MNTLLFLNLGAPELILIIFIGVIPLILALICLVDILRADFKDGTKKLLWVVIVLVAPVLGALIYLLFGRRQKVQSDSR